MKLVVVVVMVVWVICGISGDWMLEGSEGLHWKRVVRGPITLVQAFRERSVTYPDHA